MANFVLFQSAAFFGTIHILGMLLTNKWVLIYLSWLIGILTSLWNHGTTSELAKWGDRVWMGLGLAFDAAFIILLPSPLIFICASIHMLSALSYLTAKLLINIDNQNTKQTGNLAGNMPHLFAHSMISVSHVFMLYSYA